jgi:hypothetical protein
MGVVENISYDKFPGQAEDKGRRVKVCFNYDSSKVIGGVIVRDDLEKPGLMIIRLDDNRYVLSTECMYSYEQTGD